MSVTIKTVTTKKDLKSFVRFANNLYKGNKYYVPSMPMDDMNTLSSKSNAAFDFCDAELYLAYKDGKLVKSVTRTAVKSQALKMKADSLTLTEDKTYDDYLNKGSVTKISDCKIEASLESSEMGERFQFVRCGYFVKDTKNDNTFNRIVTLKDSFPKAAK